MFAFRCFYVLLRTTDLQRGLLSILELTIKNLIIAVQRGDKRYLSGHARGCIALVCVYFLSRFHVAQDTKTRFPEVALSQGQLPL